MEKSRPTKEAMISITNLGPVASDVLYELSDLSRDDAALLGT